VVATALLAEGMSMTPARFKVGDRVRVRNSDQLLPSTIGTVVYVYTAIRESYDVAYGDHHLALLWSSELDHVVDARSPERVEAR
jgi:hypothetical protein